MKSIYSEHALENLAEKIKKWAIKLGFSQVGITNIDLSEHEEYLKKWLSSGYNASMGYMNRNISKRVKPDKLIPSTFRLISVRMDYLPSETDPIEVLSDQKKAYISRYALGRDYHKVMRKRLAKLAKLITNEAKAGHCRAFVDSAPVLERAIAEKAGLGWIGKNCMLINDQAGSWFFLGEIFTDLPLPEDSPKASKHCGTCTACLDNCPTNAFVKPFVLDASRCISYLTIENRGSIDKSLRPLIGNRIFGCDDCQLVCPWNKFASPTVEDDFRPRHQLSNRDLIELFLWNEDTFLLKTAGSAIRRIGYTLWLRNLAVALGNAPACEKTVRALKSRLEFPSPLVKEHVEWALARQAETAAKS